MYGYKLGMTPNGVALGGPSNLVDFSPRWKRELHNIVDEALLFGESGVLSNSTSEEVCHFTDGQVRLTGDDVA